ncbi:hypothetical protein VCSRO39_2235 [Vibrio cholerae]|nr:hypothetical protein VCSRO39_2235 [Vibrio cholerae]
MQIRASEIFLVLGQLFFNYVSMFTVRLGKIIEVT